MTKVHDEWTVLPHGELHSIDDGILTVTGKIQMPLVNLQRRMTIIRLAKGGSVIYSAIALDELSMAKIEKWGTPKFLIVPGDAHRLDSKIYKERYPNLTIISPAGARSRVAEAVPVDTAQPNFEDPTIEFRPVDGTDGHEGALLVSRKSGVTLVLNDLIGNLRQKDGVEGWVLKVMGFGADEPVIPTVTKMMMIKAKDQLRSQLFEWAMIPNLKRILVSHGDPIEENPNEILRDLASSL